MQSGQHKRTRSRLYGKILVSHICPNHCQTLQTGAGSADLSASFQSTEFISPMACTVSLQIQWDCGQPLCCGTKGWKFSLSLIEGRSWWQQQLGSARAPAQQHLQEVVLQHISVQMCAKPEQNLTLSLYSMLFALELYFYECGLSWASSKFTALPCQNLPGLGLLFRLTAATTRGALHGNLQQPVGAATWRCTSVLGKVFSQCRVRDEVLPSWGTERCSAKAYSDIWPHQRLSCLILHLWLCIHSVELHLTPGKAA